MPNPKSKRLPRARVRKEYGFHEGNWYCGHFAVLPATAKRARLLCKVWNDPETAIKAIAKSMWHSREEAKEGEHTVRTVLAVLGFAEGAK